MRGRVWTWVIVTAAVAAASFHLLGTEGEKAREAIDDARACPTIARFGLFRAPP